MKLQPKFTSEEDILSARLFTEKLDQNLEKIEQKPNFQNFEIIEKKLTFSNLEKIEKIDKKSSFQNLALQINSRQNSEF